jgi:hypothetical protein
MKVQLGCKLLNLIRIFGSTLGCVQPLNCSLTQGYCVNEDLLARHIRIFARVLTEPQKSGCVLAEKAHSSSVHRLSNAWTESGSPGPMAGYFPFSRQITSPLSPSLLKKLRRWITVVTSSSGSVRGSERRDCSFLISRSLTPSFSQASGEGERFSLSSRCFLKSETL